jgi:hypothetical protein
LLWSASQSYFCLKRDVRKRVLEHLSTHSSNNESIGSCSNRADEVIAINLGLLPLVLVVDLIWVRYLLNVEHVLLACLLFLLLLESSKLSVVGSELPVVHYVFAGNYDVSLVHSYESWFDINGLVVNRAAYSVA